MDEDRRQEQIRHCHAATGEMAATTEPALKGRHHSSLPPDQYWSWRRTQAIGHGSPLSSRPFDVRSSIW